MRIVVDTNCILPIVVPGSYGHNVWKAFREGKYTLCISVPILLEYEEILLQRTGSKEYVDAIIAAIINAPNVCFVNPSFRFEMIKADPDDNKFVDCAITAGARYIVSDDKHFNEMKKYDFPRVDVCNLREFVQFVKIL